MTDAERDAYAVLQVHRSADRLALRAAYRALAKRYHPDGSAPDAPRMAEINHAYDSLRTPERRAAYDRDRLVAMGPGRMPEAPQTSPLARRADAERGVDQRIDFGRYEGWTISALARHDPNYLRWLSRHSAGIRFQKTIEEALPGDPHVGRRARVAR
jgi:curved DNA-binding protein CbpA